MSMRITPEPEKENGFQYPNCKRVIDSMVGQCPFCHCLVNQQASAKEILKQENKNTRSRIFTFILSMFVAAISALCVFYEVTSLAFDDKYSPFTFKISMDGVEQPSHLYGHKGEVLRCYIIGRSLLGIWASPTGGTLVFENQEIPKSSLFAPKEVSWDRLITTIRKDNPDIEIPVSIKVPQVPEQSLLNGKIIGTLIFPTSTEGGGFRNATEELNIPVNLEVVSAVEVSRRQVQALKPIGLNLLKYLVLLLISATHLVTRVIEQDRELRHWEVKARDISGIALILIFAIMVLYLAAYHLKLVGH